MLISSLSGIRGLFPEDFEDNVIEKYALAYKELQEKSLSKKLSRLIIGRDGRNSGEEIKKIFYELWHTHANIEVIDVGILPTPLVELAVREFEADGGVIITASHNPKEYNGFKFLRKNGAVLTEKETTKLIECYNSIEPPLSIKKTDIIIDDQDSQKKTIDSYKKLLKNFITCDLSKKHILLDCNGGAIVSCARELADFSGFSSTILGKTPGKFWREIEPNQKNLEEVTKHFTPEIDFAACFDCDADRVELVLKSGEVLSGQTVLALVLKALLEKIPQEYVITNNATSGKVKEILKKYNTEIIEVDVGEANVIALMEEKNILYGGEGSSGGSIISPNKCRDGFLSLVIICNFLEEHHLTLEEAVRNLPVYHTHASKFYNIDIINLRKNLINFCEENSLQFHATNKTDEGFKIYFEENTWALFRPSKTETSVLRLIVDGKDEKAVLNTVKMCSEIISKNAD